MKRYRWTKFFIDTERNLVRNPAGARDPRIISGTVAGVTYKHGLLDIQDKYDRWLSLSPPSLCVPIEWHDLLREVESAYVHGDYYPALTSACCLGERILNHLIIGLRGYFASSPRYKEVAGKDTFQDWNKLIDILLDWNVLNNDLAQQFKELLNLRNPAVHFGDLADRQKKAGQAVNAVYSVTSAMFGTKSGHFFVCEGELYVPKDKVEEPLVKEFIVPHCFLLGYKHRVESRDGKLTVVDDETYQDIQLTDDEFIEFRKAWSKGEDKGKDLSPGSSNENQEKIP
jgi:hypothetical protein